MPDTRVATRLRIGLAAVATAGLVLGLATPAQAKPAAHPKLTDSYAAVGSSHIGSINASLPIARTKLVETLDLKTLHIVSGTLAIAPQTVTFTALGVEPMRSTTTLVQAGPITGAIKATDKGNVLTTSVSYTIKLSDVEAQILGRWVPLNVGDNCQTVAPAVISVASPKGKYFDIAKGGALAGTYTIGKFQNCNLLSLPGIGSVAVNALVPGSNNTVSLMLSHGHYVAS